MNLYDFTTKSLLLCATLALVTTLQAQVAKAPLRERTCISNGWKFYRYATSEQPDSLIYDVRPEITDARDDKPADARPTEAIQVTTQRTVLKPYILPTGNAFIKNANARHTRPQGNPGSNFSFVQNSFDDNAWESVDLPHDWAIKGPFYKGEPALVGGGMGRLPSQGVAWYRKKLNIPAADAGKSIILEIDGAMSYAMVWINGHLAGGWPYGYASWQIDLTPYIKPGGINQLAIRLDNPLNSSRWYPGGGIYRNVWLTRVNKVRTAQWGTFITTRNVSAASAVADMQLTLTNQTTTTANITAVTEIFAATPGGQPTGKPVARITHASTTLLPGTDSTIKSTAVISRPKLWGPPPTQTPNQYIAITSVYNHRQPTDTYSTLFGIRKLQFDAEKGLLVNGEKIIIKGANQHHDLGALGAAFNLRAAERQLQMLRDMGCNAIRMSHNPPAPELLALTDRMGFLVVDEVFDSWETKKTPWDFHLIFPDWSEQDLRALIRRDRNHPSVILWSFGNEVGEQYTAEKGAAVARRLYQFVKEEDTTRPATVAMNYAKPDMPLPQEADVISLNYQGEGIRYSEAYKGLKGITTPPLFPKFHEKFPGKMILSSENAAALSSRGEYLFPVYKGISAPVKNKQGGNDTTQQVSAYELYSVEFGSSADKVFSTLENHPYVAGGFVWSGWDYLGEPSPYYQSRSSYFGVIDLAGFKKDRYYLYQAYWRPQHPMAHILPHWTWPDRIGDTTPVHVFTSGDEAELFLNGRSLGRKKKALNEYRLRWDEVTYQAGQLKVIAYRNGKKWAEDEVHTAGNASQLQLSADRSALQATGHDLAFITVRVADATGTTAPRAGNKLRFTIQGPGTIAATDNGNAADMQSFASTEKSAFNGNCMVIVRTQQGKTGEIKVTAEAEGLTPASVILKVQ